MSGHTSGPWIEGLDESGVVVVNRDTAHVIARLGPIWAQTEETMTRARLIASAPEQQAKIDALADALEARRSEHPRCSKTGGRDTRCLFCKQADAALRLAGRL